MMFNRKGDLAITILLFLTAALIITGITAFILDDRDFQSQSREISQTYSALDFNQNFIFKQAELIALEAISLSVADGNLKDKYKEIATKHFMDLEAEGDFFAKIRNGEFEIVKKEGDSVLDVKSVHVKAAIGDTSVERVFDIAIKLKSA